VRLERAPLLPLAAAFAAGIAVTSSPVVPAPLFLLEGAGVVLIVATAAHSCGLDRPALLLLLIGVASLGALRASSLLPGDHIARHALPPTVAVEGRIAEEPIRWTEDRVRLLLDLEGYYEGQDRRPATGRVQLTIYGELPSLGEAQRVRAEVRLYRPVGFRDPGVFDYPAHLRRQGILLIGNGRGDRVTPLTVDAPPWPVRMRRWAVAAIRAQLPESSAALLAGLLLGDRTALPPETDEAFRRAGVYHVLAVSGFNVALLASSVFAGLALLGVPRRPTAIAAAVVLLGFALTVGGQPSVVRATVMGLLLLLAILLQRDSQVMNALCLAGLLLLAWSPTSLWDPGFQLSFAATAGIVYLATPLADLFGKAGWPRWLATAVGVSLGAQLPVTPIMAIHFNQLSLIGVAANLVVVPLAGPATTLGMLAVLVHAVSETAASLLFNALWLLLIAMRLAVWVAAAVPGAMVHLAAPSWPAIATWCGALLLLPHLGSRAWTRAATLALVAATAALSVWPLIPRHTERLRISFLDVGQGDAAFIELPEGQRVLVDGGPGGPRRFDVGERVLSPFLWNLPALRLDVIALTHADADHVGGVAAVLRHFLVGEVWETGRWGPGTDETLRALRASSAARHVLTAGQRLWVGSALFTVLNPGNDGPAVAANDDSLVLRLDWRDFSALLTGDVGWPGETRILERRGPVRATVLKVGHHGSRSASGASFLDAVHPRVAVISVGPRNPFHHPSPEAVARLEAAGARVYRTDRDGAVIVESDGASLWVSRWAARQTDRFELRPEAHPPT